MFFRYSLRTLLVLILATGVTSAWLARQDYPQKRLILCIEREGGRVQYYPWSIWHPLATNRVHTVELAPRSLMASPELLEQVQCFTELQYIDVYRDPRHENGTPLIHMAPKHAAEFGGLLRGTLPEARRALLGN